jgi:predicted DNA binding CopG/RHH family protein
MAHLDDEERELLEAYERGEWRSVPDMEARIEQCKTYAEATLEREREIRVWLSSEDFDVLSRRAREKGIPYRVLAAEILHRYAAGTPSETQRSG